MIQTLDHIQLALPQGAEPAMRDFYVSLLGMVEIPKPKPLQDRGGFWASVGSMQVHFGVDPNFNPATKAHPAFVTSEIEALAGRLQRAEFEVRWDTSLPDVNRFFAFDPVGNRVEIISA